MMKNRNSCYVLPIFGFIIMALFFRASRAQMGLEMAPSPAPFPSNDGNAIDQGIAYVLMLVALAITYLIH